MTVACRRPRDLPALWVQADAATGEGLRKALAGAEVVVFAAGGGTPKESQDLARYGIRNAAVAAETLGARLVVAGPVGAIEGARHPVLRASFAGVAAARGEGLALRHVRLPALFGEGDRLLSPWLDRVVF